MNNIDKLIGIVKIGKLQILWPEQAAGTAVRLTQISMQMSMPPESQEIDLSPYEGQALMVQGHDGGDWIYEAAIIDQGGPLLTFLVNQQFSQQQASA